MDGGIGRIANAASTTPRAALGQSILKREDRTPPPQQQPTQSRRAQFTNGLFIDTSLGTQTEKWQSQQQQRSDLSPVRAHSQSGTQHQEGEDGSRSDEGSFFHGDWRGTIKEKYLSQFGITDGLPKDHPKSCRGTVWGWMIRIARLPWTAILLMAIAVALISVFIAFIVNGPSNRAAEVTIVNDTQVVSSSTKFVTVQCETDVTKEECEKRARDRVSAQDFQQAMTETHLFTTLVIFWLAATIFFVIKAMRTRKRNRYLESLPRTTMSVWADLNQSSSSSSTTENSSGNGNGGGGTTGNLGNIGGTAQAIAGNASQLPSSSMVQLGAPLTSMANGTTGSALGPGATAPTTSTAAATTMANSGVFSDSTAYLVSKLPVHSQMERSFALLRCLKSYDPFSTTSSADPNWGWKSHWDGTHFPTTVKLSSYHFLETRAVEYDPALRIRRDQTVREWLKMLKSQFTNEQLDHRTLDLFLDFYERARYGEETIDEKTWLEGMSLVYSLGESFDRMRGSRLPPAPFSHLATPPIPTIVTPSPTSLDLGTDVLNTSIAAVTTDSNLTFLTAKDGGDTPRSLLSMSQQPIGPSPPMGMTIASVLPRVPPPIQPEQQASSTSMTSSSSSSGADVRRHTSSISSHDEIAVGSYHDEEFDDDIQDQHHQGQQLPSRGPMGTMVAARTRSLSDTSMPRAPHVAVSASNLLGNVSPSTSPVNPLLEFHPITRHATVDVAQTSTTSPIRLNQQQQPYARAAGSSASVSDSSFAMIEASTVASAASVRPGGNTRNRVTPSPPLSHQSSSSSLRRPSVGGSSTRTRAGSH